MMPVQSKEILGQPLTLSNGVVIKNRMLKSAMSEVLATKRHEPTVMLDTLYRRWAEGGIGLSVTGNVMIDSKSLGEPRNVVVEDERNLEALKRWTAAGTVNDTHLWMQINHPGKQSPKLLCKEAVAPSALGYEGDMAQNFGVPRALEESEIEDLITRYGTTAAIAKKAGFTGVQIHGAHGYLVNQFLSPKHNIRTDQWGGSLENRMRFLMGVYESMRTAVGDKFPVSIKMNSADFQKGGFSEEDSMDVMQALSEAGINLIEVSGGTYEAAAMVGAIKKESTKKREAYFIQFAEEVRSRINTPLAVTGGFMTDEGMAEAIESGAVDMVGVARALALDPEFPNAILAGKGFQSTVHPIKTGINYIDRNSAMEMLYYESQFARIGKGKEPWPDMPAWVGMTMSLSRLGLQVLQARRVRT